MNSRGTNYAQVGRDSSSGFRRLRPDAVAIVGVTAFRSAFALPKAQLGQQDPATIKGWPDSVGLYVLPQPSGLNAHETIDTLADRWRGVWAAVGGTTEP